MRTFTMAVSLAGLLSSCIDLDPLPTCADFSLGREGCTDVCKTYCEAVVPLCGSEFDSVNSCRTDCAEELRRRPTINVGEPGSQGEDNLACRITQARSNNCSSAGLQPNADCPPQICNEYCDLMTQFCPPPGLDRYVNRPACLSSCLDLRPLETTAVDRNSVQCRLDEVRMAPNAANANEVNTLCAAASLAGGSECGEPCAVYCDIVQQNCTGALSVYGGSRKLCEDTCKLFPIGEKDEDQFDLDADTAECRVWHAQAAGTSSTAPAIHCPHASVYNPMFCGGTSNPPREWPCKTYCNLMIQNCRDFYSGNRSLCEADCASFSELDSLTPPLNNPQIYPVTSTSCPM